MQESKNFSAGYLTQFLIDLHEIQGLLLKLVGRMNLILILSGPLNFLGRKIYWCDFIRKKPITIGWCDVFRDLRTTFFQTWYDGRDH